MMFVVLVATSSSFTSDEGMHLSNASPIDSPGRHLDSDDEEEDNGEWQQERVYSHEDGERDQVLRPEFNIHALDFSNIRRLLTSPLPRAAGVLQCYIRREKSGANKLLPEYRVYMKEGDRFLLSSKKRSQNKVQNVNNSFK